MRKRITWTSGAKTTPSDHWTKLPPFTPTKMFDDPSWETHLQVGSLWTLTCGAVTPSSAGAGRAWSPADNGHTYIFRVGYNEPRFRQGAVAVFVGTTRVTEAKGNTAVEILRPTFVVGGIKVLTNDLTLFQPIHVTDGQLEDKKP